jgi:hypothetical protein
MTSVFTNVIKVICFAMLAFSAQVTLSFSAEPIISYIDDQEQSEKVLGSNTGQILVVGLEKACPQVRDIVKTTNPDQITLLLADENLSTFSKQVCVDKCDLLELNNIVVACKKTNGQANCFVIGAAFQNTFHILAIDAYGQRLQDTCK